MARQITFDERLTTYMETASEADLLALSGKVHLALRLKFGAAKAEPKRRGRKPAVVIQKTEVVA